MSLLFRSAAHFRACLKQLAVDTFPDHHVLGAVGKENTNKGSHERRAEGGQLHTSRGGQGRWHRQSQTMSIDTYSWILVEVSHT